MIELHVLGPTQLRRDGRDVHSVLAQPKRLALLTWLAVAGRHGLVRRESALLLFWPDLGEERARAALRQSLHMLRQSLGAEALDTAGSEELRLSDEVRCDVVAFESAVRDGRHADALDLYRGEMLAGLNLQDTPEWDRWLDGERLRLRELALGAALTLAGNAATPAAAVAATERALQVDVASQAAMRGLLRAAAAAGDAARALRRYDAWRRDLQDDLGLEPDPETETLADSLRAGSRVPRVEPPSRPVGAAAAGVPEPAGAAAAGVPEPPGTAAASVPEPAGTAAATTVLPEYTARAPAPAPRPHRAAWGIAAAAAVVVATVAGALLLGRARGGTVDAAITGERVLVLAFDNRTGDPSLQPIGEMAGDWIAQGLLETELVDVVSASDMLSAANVADAARTSASPADVARATRAALVVKGAVYLQRDSLRLLAHVHDADGAMLVSIPPVVAPADDPMPAIAALRERTMAALAPRLHPRLRSWSPAMAAPPSYEAYRAFVAGVSLHNQSRWREAIAEQARASALAPDFAQAKLWAAKSWMNLPDYRAADSIARELAPLRDRLNFMDRLMLEWIEASVRGDNQARLQHVQELARRLPGAELVRYQLGYELMRTGDAVEAVATLERIDPDAGFMIGWFPFWQQYCTALHMNGQHARELAAARQARLRFTSLRPLLLEITAYAAMGDTARVFALADTVATRPPDGGVTPAAVLIEAAQEMAAHGHPRAAAHLAAKLVDLSAAGRVDASPSDRAFALILAGRPRDALELLDDPEALDPVATMLRGMALHSLGDTRGVQEADQRLRRGTAAGLPGRATWLRARLAAHTGGDAAALREQALREGMPYGLAVHRLR